MSPKTLLGRITFIGVVIVATLPLTAMTASAATTDHCGPEQSPHYVFGFANLQRALGDQMGQAISCEFADPNGTGDVHQQTTAGLAFWRKRSNTPTFTNGYDHWALTASGTVRWVGSSIDPPSVAPPAVVPTPRPSVPPVLRPSTPPAQANSALPAEPALRAAVVSAANDISTFWSATLPGYKPFNLYWYRGTATSGCGTTGSDGPFYCPADQSVYLETPFFEALWKKGWNFGLQVIVAHEVGHHVQRLSGLRVMALPNRPGQLFTIEAELGADCLAGMWAGDAFRRGLATGNSIREAWDISYAAGDGAGTPWYGRDAHGTPTQRTDAFMLGVRDDSARECLAI